MSLESTHAARIITELEYVEETPTTYRVFPTNPAMVYLAETAKVVHTIDFPQKEFRRLGSEDVFKHINTREDYQSTLDFGVSESTFLKFGINAPVGAGTIDRSLSMGYSIEIDGIENFIKMTGSRIEAMRLHLDSESDDLQCSCDLVHSLIDDPTITDYIGSGSHGTPGTTEPISGATPSIPFTWNAVEEDILDFNATFTRNLSNKRPIGDPRIKFQRSTMRKIAGDFTVEWNKDTGTSLEDDLRAGAARTFVYNLSGAIALTFTNTKLFNLSGRDIDAQASESVPMKLGFVAESANIT